MNLIFSDRIGKTKVRTELLKDGLSPEMTNTIWTLIYDRLIGTKDNSVHVVGYSDITRFFRFLYGLIFLDDRK